MSRANWSGGVEFDRSIESLEPVRRGPAILQVRSGALIDRVGHQNLVGCGDGLGPGRRVDDIADGGEIAVRLAELAEAEFAGVDPDADAKLTGTQPEAAGETVTPLAPVVLNLARRNQGVPGVLVALHGKIEDGHHGVADRLVQEAVTAPDRVGAFVVEGVEQPRDGIR